MPQRKVRRAVAAPVAARRVVNLTVTIDEGNAITAHLQALDAVWQEVCKLHHLPDPTHPCSHSKAALRLILFPRDQGLTPIDRVLFARANLPLPDLTIEAGPLAGTDDVCALAVHAATGCRSVGEIPTLRVSYERPVVEEVPSFATATAPAYPHEAAVLAGYTKNLELGITATMNAVGSERACIHLASAIRRGCAATSPRAAALEVEVLVRAGASLPEYRDETVDRWMHSPSDDGSLKEHLDGCPLANEPEHWPAVVVSVDGAVCPVRVPAAAGFELKWPEARWS